MAHESFEDEEVAALMNQVFINIKVDREERPDIDGVYMQIAQMITGKGGWPLTIIMTPNKEPFFAATYIPKTDRYNTMGMLSLVPRIRELWENDPSNISEVTTKIKEALAQEGPTRSEDDLDVKSLDHVFNELSDRFDEARGGFSRAPKFPSPHNLLILLRFWNRTGNTRALDMVTKTLHNMRTGGIFDQIGFGFHRYSTDAYWLLPHFEKMLYDQASLMMAYAEAFQATGEPVFGSTVEEIFQYVTRDLRSPEGAFYSAEDADSEGVEGKFYVWAANELKASLDDEEYSVFSELYNIRKEGNFQDEATGEDTELNIPHITKSVDAVAKSLGKDAEEIMKIADRARSKLFAIREKRIRPSRDEKILTDWNGFMIAALAQAGRVLGNNNMITAAETALKFIQSNMMDEDMLYHRYGDGEVAVPAFLDDYAYLIWGLLELYESTFNHEYLILAKQMNEEVLAHFWDPEGGFFFTADYAEELLLRRKDAYDGAMPSGNSVSFYNTVRLARLLGDSSLEEKATEIVRAFASDIRRGYSAYSMMLVGLDLAIGPSYEVVLAGNLDSSDLQEMVDALHAVYIPRKVVLMRGSKEQEAAISGLAPFTKFHTPIGGMATAHVCVDHNCKLPTNEIARMLQILGAT